MGQAPRRMTRYVLDTHAYVLAVRTPKKLGANARRALQRVENGQAEALVPAATVTEVLMLKDLRRTDIGFPEVRASLARAPSMRFLPLDLSQMETFASLASLRDPFDRLIVSAAIATGSKLVSKDSLLAESGLVEVVW